MYRSKRILSVLMAMVMVFSLLPVQAFATEGETEHQHDDTGLEEVIEILAEEEAGEPTEGETEEPTEEEGSEPTEEETEAIATVAGETADVSIRDGDVTITYSDFGDDGGADAESDEAVYYWNDASVTGVVTDRIVISNNTEDYVLRVTYEILSDITNVAVTNAQVSGTTIDVAPETSAILTVTVAEDGYAEMYLNGFVLTEIVETEVQFLYDASLGSITVNGEELSYSKSLRMIGTAYTAGIGVVNNTTATGTQVRVGVVAVDKRVIPLGTKLFIEAANGSYIYGTAVAEDTGVRGNVIDLYMNSYADCVNFGRRDVNVYILD